MESKINSLQRVISGKSAEIETFTTRIDALTDKLGKMTDINANIYAKRKI